MDEADRLDLGGTLFQFAAHLLVFLFHLAGHGSPAVLQRFREIGCGDVLHIATDPLERIEAGTAHHVLQIGPCEAFGLPGDISQADVACQRHAGGMDAEDLLATCLVRRADIDQFVEAARPQQGRIHQRRAIGRPDHYHRLQFFQPVHFGKDRIDHAAGDLWLALPAAASRHETVDLVDEYNAGRHGTRTLEHLGDLLLAFAVPFGQKVARLHRYEVRFGFLCHGFGKQGLARARRTVEQETLGRPDTQPMESVRVFQRQFDAFLQLLDSIAHAADVRPPDIGNLHHHFAHSGRLDALECGKEILAADVEIVEHFGRDGPLVEVDPGHDPAHGIDRRLAGQRRDIRAHEAVSGLGELAQIHLVAQRHAARVNA